MFLTLVAIMATQAQAQLVTYQFTGSPHPVYGTNNTSGIGSTVAGSVTLDVGAAPTYTYDHYYYCGEEGQWQNGGFSIDGMTDTGLGGGTSLGGDTSLWVYDWPCYYYFPYNGTGIYSYSYDGTRERSVQLWTNDYVTVGDGIANVPNPWDPASASEAYISVWDYDYSTGVYQYGYFSIDSFTSTIIIDGCDTGVQDFVYEGQTVSQHIADCASSAKNHGDFVSCVAKLTNSLKKAGLLTGAEKGTIMDCAAQSSIGK